MEIESNIDTKLKKINIYIDQIDFFTWKSFSCYILDQRCWRPLHPDSTRYHSNILYSYAIYCDHTEIRRTFI